MHTAIRPSATAANTSPMPNRRLLAWMLFALSCAMTHAGPAVAGDAKYKLHVVQFRVGTEPPSTFVYAAGNANVYGTSELETQWYLARTRADHGSGGKIVAVDGLAYEPATTSLAMTSTPAGD